jgi:hypothetical protein
LLPLNGISFQRQFWIKEILEKNGHPQAEFHGKNLSTISDWGENVPLVWYIPTSAFWVASQSALKAPSGHVCQMEDREDANDDEDDVQPTDPNLITLAKYRRQIVGKGFTYFQEADKVWWIDFFEKSRKYCEELSQGRTMEI